MSTTGERIRELRLRNHLSLDDVARHLGVGRQAIHKYEQGTVTNIPLENIEKMANLFGTTPGYLAGWNDSPKMKFLETEMTFDSPLVDALPERIKPQTPQEDAKMAVLWRSASLQAKHAAIAVLESMANEKLK